MSTESSSAHASCYPTQTWYKEWSCEGQSECQSGMQRVDVKSEVGEGGSGSDDNSRLPSSPRLEQAHPMKLVALIDEENDAVVVKREGVAYGARV
eukprot:2011767-Amphidinium_carterae.1